MPMRLEILAAQREAAEKAYNEWLTRVDSLHRLPLPYEKYPALTEALRKINELAGEVTPEMPALEVGGGDGWPAAVPLPASIELERYPRSLKGRIKERVRAFVCRLLQIEDRLGVLAKRIDWIYQAQQERSRQQYGEIARLTGILAARDRQIAEALAREAQFHSALVAYLNVYAQALHDLSAHQQDLEAARIRFLQTITAMVDTKDRETNGLINNHFQNVFNHLQAGDVKLRDLIQNRIELLSGRLDVMLESFDRKLEKVLIQLHETALKRDALHREFQHGTDLQRLAETHLRETLSDVTTAVMGLRRQVETIRQRDSRAESVPAAPADTLTSVNDYMYSVFEARYRGSEELIRDRFAGYADLFSGCAPVLDAGCGRGEFLELLHDRSIDAYGIDVNEDSVSYCREKGLRAEQAGMVEHLSALSDASLGGIFSAQVVEHLEPRYLLRFLELAFFRLRKGGVLVVETINPTSLYAMFEAYFRDLTHIQPIHPDTLRFFAEASGFVDVSVQYKSPVPDEIKLTGDDPNTKKLNRLLFGDQDYAVIARKV